MELTPGAVACASCATRFLCLDEPNPVFRGGREMGLRRLQTTVLVKPLSPERRPGETPPYFLRSVDRIAHTSSSLPSGLNSHRQSQTTAEFHVPSKITGHRQVCHPLSALIASSVSRSLWRKNVKAVAPGRWLIKLCQTPRRI